MRPLTHLLHLVGGAALLLGQFCAPPRAAGIETSVFSRVPSGSNWVTIWDEPWHFPANDAQQRGDNGSHLILAEPAARGNYEFNLLPDTPWGATQRVHTIRLPAGMPGGHTRQVVWPLNEGSGRGPLTWSRDLTPKGDLYLGFFIRFRGSQGRPYRLENLGGQKMLYARPTPEPAVGSFAHIFIRKGGSPTGGGWAGFEPQPSRGTVCESASYFAENSAPIGVDGVWSCIEYLVLANTRDDRSHQLDGNLEIHVDGRLQCRRTNVLVYCTGQAAATMNGLSLNPIYGGGTNPVPYDLFVDYGRMKIMGR